MKFYKDKKSYIYFNKSLDNKLTAVYQHLDKYYFVHFFKNGKFHNSKNADYIDGNGFKDFSLNGKFYGRECDFTKESWRRFVKLQVFL
jgi:hypothetical protein